MSDILVRLWMRIKWPKCSILPRARSKISKQGKSSVPIPTLGKRVVVTKLALAGPNDKQSTCHSL